MSARLLAPLPGSEGLAERLALEQFPSVVTRGGIPKASRVRFTVRAGEEAGGYGQTSFG